MGSFNQRRSWLQQPRGASNIGFFEDYHNLHLVGIVKYRCSSQQNLGVIYKGFGQCNPLLFST